MHLHYRPDIDGLRAIAVLAVVGYHYGLPHLSGGFVGVDIFFVISGYLITGMIKERLDAGRFSFREFYLRRARRLMPALLVVTALTFVAGFLILSPELMQNLAKSAVATVLAVSNILFWRETDYFDIGARVKPLLHTWSLSVEWQFYALWPAFIALIYRWRRSLTPLAIVTAGSLSFLANLAFQDGYFTLLDRTPALAWIADGRATIFYNMPFRVFEFAAGAILLWLPAIRRNLVAEAALALGLLGIAYCCLRYDTALLFPSWNGLLPTAAAALAIYGGNARFTGLALRNPGSAYMGRISYAVYLVHWPLIVFAEYALLRTLAPGETAKLAMVALAAAIVLHHTIELPLHKGLFARSRPAFAGSIVAASAILAVSVAATRDGFVWRLDEANGISVENVATQVPKNILGRIGCDASCTFGSPDGVPVLLVGDSHLDHHTKALDQLGGDRYRFSLVYAASCFFGRDYVQVNPVSELNDKKCDAARAELERLLADQEYAAIVVGELWSGYKTALHRESEPRDSEKLSFPDLKSFYAAALDDLGRRFAGFPDPIIVLGRAPNTNLDCYRRPLYLPLTCPQQVNFDEFGDFASALEDFRRRALLNIAFVDVAPVICPQQKCRLTDAEGHPLYSDAHHLSVYGSRLIVPHILALLPDGMASEEFNSAASGGYLLQDRQEGPVP